MKSFLRTKEPK